MSTTNGVKAKIRRLNPGLMKELDNFLDYLLHKKTESVKSKLSQNWAGGLKDVNESGLTLQKKSLDWREG